MCTVESMGVALEEEKKLKIESANVERVDRYSPPHTHTHTHPSLLHTHTLTHTPCPPPHTQTTANSDLVKNLVLGYVHTTDAKKPEVLRLMGKILNFTDDELSGAIGSGRGKQWLWGLWSTPPSTQVYIYIVIIEFLYLLFF